MRLTNWQSKSSIIIFSSSFFKIFFKLKIMTIGGKKQEPGIPNLCKTIIVGTGYNTLPLPTTQ